MTGPARPDGQAAEPLPPAAPASPFAPPVSAPETPAPAAPERPPVELPPAPPPVCAGDPASPPPVLDSWVVCRGAQPLVATITIPIANAFLIVPLPCCQSW